VAEAGWRGLEEWSGAGPFRRSRFARLPWLALLCAALRCCMLAGNTAALALASLLLQRCSCLHLFSVAPRDFKQRDGAVPLKAADVGWCFGADRMRLGPTSKARIGVTCTSRALQRAAFSYRAYLAGCLSLPFALLLCLAPPGSSSRSQECWLEWGRARRARSVLHCRRFAPCNTTRSGCQICTGNSCATFRGRSSLYRVWGGESLLADDSLHPGPSCNGTRFTGCCSAFQGVILITRPK
jgi:hypothetical protein